MLGIAVMMNNYFHDLATALLATSGVVLWVFGRVLDRHDASSVQTYFVDAYHRLTRLAIVALVWIIIGGAIRAATYRQFEWANAVGNAQVPALVVKHVVLFAAVALGAAAWLKLRARVRAFEGAGDARAPGG